MRILFVWPNKDQFGCKPIGISLLSAICKQEGYETDLFDTTFFDFGYADNTSIREEICIHKSVDFSGYDVEKKNTDLKSEFIKTLNRFSPNVVCFSALSDEYAIALELSKYTKEYSLDIITVFGNKYATICPDDVINERSVDFVCIGEGIEALPELLTALDQDKNTANIKNIWAKINGIVIKNDVRPCLPDLDTLPYLDWDMFDERHSLRPYDGKLYTGGDYMSNWGCLNQCTYCINEFMMNIYGKSKYLRSFSPQRSIDELIFLKDKYSLNFIRFYDEDFLMRPLSKLKEFAVLYEKEIALPFVIETNPISVNEEKVRILNDMGCVSATLGIESGNDYIRRVVLKRKESKEDIENAFKLLNKYQIRSASFNMIGLPYETRSAFFDTVNVNIEAKVKAPDIGFFYPFEGTKLRDVSIEEGFFDPIERPIYEREKPALNHLTDLPEDELIGLNKTFLLYVKLPKIFYPLIERAEKNDITSKEIFKLLAEIYNEYVLRNDGFFNYNKLCKEDLER